MSLRVTDLGLLLRVAILESIVEISVLSVMHARGDCLGLVL